MEFANCRLMLPETGAIVTSLRVATSSASPTATAASPCAPAASSSSSPSSMASTIQRYILKVERERNARERITAESLPSNKKPAIAGFCFMTSGQKPSGIVRAARGRNEEPRTSVRQHRSCEIWRAVDVLKAFQTDMFTMSWYAVTTCTICWKDRLSPFAGSPSHPADSRSDAGRKPLAISWACIWASSPWSMGRLEHSHRNRRPPAAASGLGGLPAATCEVARNPTTSDRFRGYPWSGSFLHYSRANHVPSGTRDASTREQAPSPGTAGACSAGCVLEMPSCSTAFARPADLPEHLQDVLPLEILHVGGALRAASPGAASAEFAGSTKKPPAPAAPAGYEAVRRSSGAGTGGSFRETACPLLRISARRTVFSSSRTLPASGT